MKKLLIALFILISANSFSQAKQQIDLVSSFFTEQGYQVVKNMAHTFYTQKGGSVKAGETRNYFVTINYSNAQTEFSCEYKIMVSPRGEFERVTVSKCGNKEYPCFMDCEVAGTDALAKEENKTLKQRYEQYIGKPLEKTTCEEYTMLSLYFVWIDKGFAAKYRNN